jgi:hypothetical protein
MSGSDDTATRLLRLEQILARPSEAASSGNSDPADPAAAHLAAVAADRIHDITAALQSRTGQPTDALDILTMRLLLSEYVTAAAQLRAMARATEQRLAAAAAPIKDGKGFVRRLKRRHAPGDRRADGNDVPPQD